MDIDTTPFKLTLADREDDLMAAARLRYEVFVDELGGDGPLVDHEARMERDAFDPDFDHLVLIDQRRDRAQLDHVVGVYRLLPGGRSARFYSEDEYDLRLLKDSGRRLLELGRSCVHRDYRSGLALHLLWQGLGHYVLDRKVELLFGVASLHGTDITSLAPSLALLHHKHLAPTELRVRAQSKVFQPMDLMPLDQIDRVAAAKNLPALIKSYLKLGGFVGEGAFIDHAFNTTDVCLVIDVDKMPAAARARYSNAEFA